MVVWLLRQFDVVTEVLDASEVKVSLNAAANFFVDVVAVVDEEAVVVQTLFIQHLYQLVFVGTGDPDIIDEHQHLTFQELAVQVEVIVPQQFLAAVRRQEAVVARVRHFAMSQRQFSICTVAINQQVVEAIDKVSGQNCGRIWYEVVRRRDDDDLVRQQFRRMRIEEAQCQIVTELAGDFVRPELQLRVLLRIEVDPFQAGKLVGGE